MKPVTKQLGGYLRGFARAANLPATELAALYLVLALEQAELASVGVVLTLELWLEAAQVTWRWRKSQ